MFEYKGNNHCGVNLYRKNSLGVALKEVGVME